MRAVVAVVLLFFRMTDDEEAVDDDETDDEGDGELLAPTDGVIAAVVGVKAETNEWAPTW